jgi:hypothetical protein
MPEKLYEAEFLSVDIKSMFNNKKTNDTSSTEGANNNDEEGLTWGDKLKQRLAKNKELSPEARQTEFDIKSKLFEEFFTAEYPDIAKQLLAMDALLQQDIVNWGFDKKNPIIAFIKQDFVQKNLIKTNLLNATTYKALREAVIKKLVADSEFSYVKASTYSVIYCPDWYRRPNAKMIDYLKVQNEILPGTGGNITGHDIVKLKRILYNFAESTEPDPRKRALKAKAFGTDNEIFAKPIINVKLNELNIIPEIKGVLSGGKKSTQTVALNSKSQNALINKLNTIEKKFAAIQYFSISTNSEEAKNAIMDKRFSELNMLKVIAATREIADNLPKGQLNKNDANEIVKTIMGSL